MGSAVIVTKEFHFYAAHRNEEIGGKCANIHGHRYGLVVSVEAEKKSSISMLFGEVEAFVEPLLRRLDHCLILNKSDPCAPALVHSGACGKVYWIDGPASAENVAENLIGFLRNKCGLKVASLTLRETDSSSVTVTP